MGCLYPPMVKTVSDQLEAAKLTWRWYMEDMGNDPTRESATCGHMPPGAVERTGRATVKDKYAAKHDPFVYFHSIIDSPECQARVVDLTWIEGFALANSFSICTMRTPSPPP